MTDSSPDRSWWTTLPGVLTGLAALLTALTGLLALFVTFLQGRAAPDPAPPRPPVVIPVPPGPAPTPGPEPRPTPVRPGGGPPPLVLGERLEVAGTAFEVLNVEDTPLRGGGRDIRVTFRTIAGETKVTLSRSNVRILSPGRVDTPVEGLPVTDIPAGATRQFWVRFQFQDTPLDPVLSFTDDWIAPRGEVRRALAPG